MSFEASSCFNNLPRQFLVSVTVHKARNLDVLNADTFVKVNFNSEKKKTKTFQNSDCPFFNEYFVFEIKTSLDDLLKMNIRLSVVQASCLLKKKAIIGETNVNLTTVWKQNYHAFLKKWVILEKIGEAKLNSSAGYLQVDLSIVSANDSPAPATLQLIDDDIIEENLLLPVNSKTDQEDVKYLVNIFHGSFVAKRDYILQVSFGSYHTRTREVKESESCKWNEKFIFKGKFLSLNQLLVFELLVYDHYQWRLKCSYEVNFNELSWEIKGSFNKPSFGPVYIYFYKGVLKNVFCGKVLISIETQDIDPTMTGTLQRKQDIYMKLNESEYWNEEDFNIKMILVNMDALNLQQNRLQMYLRCENIFSNNIEVDLNDYDGKTNVKYVKFNANIRPFMTLSIKLPDNRRKFHSLRLLYLIVLEMETNVKSFKIFEANFHDNFEYQTRCIKMLFSDLLDMLEGVKAKFVLDDSKKLTVWDENFMKFLQSSVQMLITEIQSILGGSVEGSTKKRIFREYINMRNSISSALNEAMESEPEIFLDITCDGKLLAFKRFKLMKYVYSQSFEGRGEHCGKIHSVLIKPTTCMHSCDNCGCYFGKIELLMWIGIESEVAEWLPQNAVEMTLNRINFNVEQYLKCNVFVHQAKIQPGFDKSGLCDPKLSMTLNGQSQSTKVVKQSLAAVWNEVIVIENIKVFDIGDDTQLDYPAVMMLLFDEDKRKVDLIGVGMMKVPLKPASHELSGSKTQPKALMNDEHDIRKLFHQVANQFPPQLRWIALYRDGLLKAEILMSAELVKLLCLSPITRNLAENDPIPREICPVMQNFRLDVTFVGVRNSLKLPHFASGRYRMELTMGELKLSSGFSGKAFSSNLNFLDPFTSGFLLLPEQVELWPPITIKHLDCKAKIPTVLGASLIRRPKKFRNETKSMDLQKFLFHQNALIDVEAPKLEERFEFEESEPLLGVSSVTEGRLKLKQAMARLRFPKFLQFSAEGDNDSNPLAIEKEYTWWNKFYNSNRDEEFKNESVHQLKIFHNELEKQSYFECFNDWAVSVDLIRGKNGSGKSEKYASLKCSIKITKSSGAELLEAVDGDKLEVEYSTFKRNLMVEVPIVIRVYVVQALKLKRKDVFGNTDAFIKVQFGSQEIYDQANYVPNQSSPVFGKRFQLSGVLPRETLLKISVYDRDTLSRNDLVGSTTIDIEDRVQTKYLANCAISSEYNSSGYNSWRNAMLPSEILSSICNDNQISPPQYLPDRVLLGGIEITDQSKITKDTNIKERLALSALKNLHQIPGFGYSLVPEHVETRSLYRDDRVGIEQGKLQLWIEIFDPKRPAREPLDITPISPRAYELRVIIWNVKDVTLDESNIFGHRMSDIYVKCWLDDIARAQCTDVHYRSLNGEGSFNWRMIFHMKYSIGEDMIVITKKRSPFEHFDSEVKMPAVLNVQIWDNDKFSPDDFLGTLSINLSHFPKLITSSDKCLIGKNDKICENLFASNRSVRGWIPVYGKSDGDDKIKQTGKLEIELEVMLQDKARANPVGFGRDGPDNLPLPNRPDSSFNWLSNPLRSAKHILLPEFKKFGITILAALILFLVISFIIISDVPQKIFSKLALYF